MTSIWDGVVNYVACTLELLIFVFAEIFVCLRAANSLLSMMESIFQSAVRLPWRFSIVILACVLGVLRNQVVAASSTPIARQDNATLEARAEVILRDTPLIGMISSC